MSEKNGFFSAATRGDHVIRELLTVGELEKVVLNPLYDLLNKAYRMKQFKPTDPVNSEAHARLDRASAMVSEIIRATAERPQNTNDKSVLSKGAR